MYFIGFDSLNRPVYKDKNGKLWKDIYPREDHYPEIYSVYSFDGEPDVPLKEEYELYPCRMVWSAYNHTNYIMTYMMRFLQERSPLCDPSDNTLEWEQFRSMFTTYCLMENIDEGAKRFNDLLYYLYHFTEADMEYEEFVRHMGKNLNYAGSHIELGNLLFGNSRGNFRVPREWVEHFLRLTEYLHMDSYGFYYDSYTKSIGSCTEVIPNEKYNSAYLRDDGGFENDTFLIKPYYWGDDEDESEKPNFVYKPTGYEIDWYKYPFRDSYSNFDITEKEFIEIIENCLKSVSSL